MRGINPPPARPRPPPPPPPPPACRLPCPPPFRTAAGVVKLLHDCVMFLGPFILELLLKHLQTDGSGECSGRPAPQRTVFGWVGGERGWGGPGVWNCC